MARLFIFGNGYDIAHNIKDQEGNPQTTYIAFKKWLIKNVILPKESDFKEENIVLTGMFDNVGWISDAFIYEKILGSDRTTADQLGAEETKNAQLAFAKVIVWLFNNIKNKLGSDDTWKNFEENLGELEESILDLIKLFGLEEKNDFSIQKIERVVEELKHLWKEWVNSIILSDISANEYDQNIIKKLNSNDIVLTVNYTETVETIFKSTDNIFHIHGNRENENDELYVGHGNKRFEDFSKAYSDISPECVAYTVEYKLLKPVTQIIKENIDVFSKIKKLFDNDKINEIYSCGFSFSEVDKEYIVYLKDILDTDKIIWYLSKHDKVTDQQRTKDKKETYRDYLTKIGFKTEYTKY